MLCDKCIACYTCNTARRSRMYQAEVKNNRTDRIEKLRRTLLRENVSWARKALGGALGARAKGALDSLTREFGFSGKGGDLQILNSNWYVTHTGLLRLARRKRCRGIHVEAVDSLCDSAANRFVLKATVYPSKDSAGFVGYGDADPSNVSLLVRGAEMRIAETRAVNRALRKAYGIGICSVEEIGSNPGPMAGAADQRKFPPQNTNGNGNGNGGAGHKVRDRLCQIIRQHHPIGDRILVRWRGLPINVSFRPKIPTETGTAMVVLVTRFATGSVRSFASTNSIPNW